MKVRTTCTMARIVGYYRPIARWNEGKRQELKDRAYASASTLAEGDGSRCK